MEPCLAPRNSARVVFTIERLSNSHASTCIQAVSIHSKQIIICCVQFVWPTNLAWLDTVLCSDQPVAEKKISEICGTHVWKLWSWDAYIPQTCQYEQIYWTYSPAWTWNGFHLYSYASWRRKLKTILKSSIQLCSRWPFYDLLAINLRSIILLAIISPSHEFLSYHVKLRLDLTFCL